MKQRRIGNLIACLFAALVGVGLAARVSWTDGATATQPATTRPAPAPPLVSALADSLAASEARATAAEADISALRADVAELKARPAPSTAPSPQPAPLPLPYLDPRNFRRADDTDDGAAIQRAIDSLVSVNPKTGVPNSGKVTHQATYPNGGTVRLSPGLYVCNRPIKVWGMVRLVGSGPDAFLWFPNSAGIDLAGVELGGPGSGFSNDGSVVADLAIDAKGHGVFSSTGGTLTGSIERVQVTSGGWMAYLPGEGPGTRPKDDVASPLCYCQDFTIRDCHHMHPNAGSVLIRGNFFEIDGLKVTGAARATFASPFKDGLAMVDVGGAKVSIRRAHVEFSAPKTAAIRSLALRGRAAGRNYFGWAHVEDCWLELWPVDVFLNAGGFSVTVDNCEWRGNANEEIGGRVEYVNGGKKGN